MVHLFIVNLLFLFLPHGKSDNRTQHGSTETRVLFILCSNACVHLLPVAFNLRRFGSAVEQRTKKPGVPTQVPGPRDSLPNQMKENSDYYGEELFFL